MSTTNVLALFYPSGASTSGYQSDMSTMASSDEAALVSTLAPVFTNSTTRDAAYTAASLTPLVGWKCRLTSDEVVYRHNGSSWVAWESDWATWTPTYTNLTLGTGGTTDVARGRYVGGLWCFEWSVTLGSSGFSVGDVSLSIPVSTTSSTIQPLGSGMAYDSSATTSGYFKVYGFRGSTAALIQLRPDIVGAGNFNRYGGTMSSLIPFTWAAGDRISLTGQMGV